MSPSHERDGLLLVAEHELEPSAVLAQVEADHLVAVIEGAASDPGAEATESAGDQNSLSQGARPGRR